MEALLKGLLNSETCVDLHSGGGGCINQGQSYSVDQGKIFVKFNAKKGADVMFEGEYHSLKAIESTDTVRVPMPIQVSPGPDGRGHVLVFQHLDMEGLTSASARLGRELAELHLHNQRCIGEARKLESNVTSTRKGDHVMDFGFKISTCCGFLPMDNSWRRDWVEFYARQRLQTQMDMLMKSHGDRQAMELWSELQLKLDRPFKGMEIFPSLLHGDLWAGNVAESEGRPVIFDPGSYYGHHEFDLAIADMFGGFSSSFYEVYHDLIPRANGHHARLELYKLFHYLNHWNHFGNGYRSSTLNAFRNVLGEVGQ